MKTVLPESIDRNQSRPRVRWGEAYPNHFHIIMRGVLAAAIVAVACAAKGGPIPGIHVPLPINPTVQVRWNGGAGARR